MAGIYIHIPFCRQKCYYCDFYKTVNTSLTGKFISALRKEILNRIDYLEGENIETIYFGGGTPSVLNEKELKQILGFLQDNFVIIPDVEITFESNPDDLTPEYLEALSCAGINRLSIGIQSFLNEHLHRMNRRHDVCQAVNSVENAAIKGFKNISLDLIYGLPQLTSDQWLDALNQIFKLPFQHLSAYHLTYHKGTPFYTWLKKGILKEIGETESVEQYNTLIDIAEKQDFEQYEISNFAKNKMYSKHNSSYWTGKKYLGLGPSAHSFNGSSRQWNVSHVESYIKAIKNGGSYYEEEKLSENEMFNEFLITRLRTKWGISIMQINQEFGLEKSETLVEVLKKYKISGYINEQDNVFTLTRKGLFISDEILSNLMII